VSLSIADCDRPALLFWRDLVPEQVAVDQARWEGRREVGKMRMAGLTFKEIGLSRGVSLERGRMLFIRWQRESADRSPVERYLSEEPIKVYPDRVIWRNVWRKPPPE